MILFPNGFHFHKKSSILDWLIYYPIERFMASKTDAIITINKEDYKLIQRFKVKYKEYIPGVGVDTQEFKNEEVDSTETKRLYGIPSNGFVIVSTGELSKRKNQGVIIKAISKIKNPNIYYLICGEGNQRENYSKLIKSLNLFLPNTSQNFISLVTRGCSLLHCSIVATVFSILSQISLLESCSYIKSKIHSPQSGHPFEQY